MSFPRYPSYKDSGVEWLGELPEHWASSPQPLSHQGRGAKKRIADNKFSGISKAIVSAKEPAFEKSGASGLQEKAANSPPHSWGRGRGRGGDGL
jgi:hypothetical protein